MFLTFWLASGGVKLFKFVTKKNVHDWPLLFQHKCNIKLSTSSKAPLQVLTLSNC